MPNFATTKMPNFATTTNTNFEAKLGRVFVTKLKLGVMTKLILFVVAKLILVVVAKLGIVVVAKLGIVVVAKFEAELGQSYTIEELPVLRMTGILKKQCNAKFLDPMMGRTITNLNIFVAMKHLCWTVRYSRQGASSTHDLMIYLDAAMSNIRHDCHIYNDTNQRKSSSQY